jgi:sugar-specific transcriptional regulator TrmB
MTSQKHAAEILQALGLSADEASVYMTALALGTRPASMIAQKSGLKRSHTYNILGSLQEKGIIQEYTRNGVRHFAGSPPRNLLSMVDTKIQELSTKRESLEQALPSLEELQTAQASQPKVRFYRGLEGIKEIMEDVLLSECDVLYSFNDLEYSWSSHTEDARSWLQGFIQRREALGIRWHGIAVKSSFSDQELMFRSSSLRHVKMMQGVRLPAEVIVYGKKAALTSTFEEMIGVVIESEQIAQAIQAIHQTLWNLLPDYEIEESKLVNS